MPFDNLNSGHYGAEEITAIETHLSDLESALKPKFKNLTPEERQKYGSVNEQNKLIINKVLDFRSHQPDLCSPDVDWDEFSADYQSRNLMQSLINRLQNLIDGLSNNKILHDYDNYQASLTDYDFCKYKANTNTHGFENKMNELSQFFNRTGTTNTAKPTETTQS